MSQTPPTTPIQSPAAWKSADIAQRSSEWLLQVNAQDIDEIKSDVKILLRTVVHVCRRRGL